MALSSPARADEINFAQGTPDVAPAFQWIQDGDGVGGTLTSIGLFWRFKEVLPAALMDGLLPASGVATAFSFSASTQGAYGCTAGACGIGGLSGSFSYIYTGPTQNYSTNGFTRTIHAGDNVLTVVFEDAFLSDTGSGALQILTADGATITSLSSDILAPILLDGVELLDQTAFDYDFRFHFTDGSLNVSPNGKNFNDFNTNAFGNFTAITATTAVPEPATLTLTLLGSAVMLARRRARRAM